MSEELPKANLPRRFAPATVQCRVPGCARQARRQVGYCSMHEKRIRDNGEPGSAEPKRTHKYKGCKVEGCERFHCGLGYCAMHLHRFRRTGTIGPIKSQRKGYGDGWLDPNGYRVIVCHGHPNSDKRGKILEHIYVMSHMLGRALHKGETVHHKNGLRGDNRPENLELWTSRHQPGQRVEDLLKDAAEVLQRYASDPSVWPASLKDLRQTILSFAERTKE